MRMSFKTTAAAFAALGLALGCAAGAWALEGAYTVTGESMPFTFSDGVISGTTDDGVMVHDAYAIDGNTITITAPDDHPICPGAVGVYSFEETDAQVTFTLVSDTCEIRAQGMTAGPWMKVHE